MTRPGIEPTTSLTPGERSTTRPSGAVAKGDRKGIKNDNKDRGGTRVEHVKSNQPACLHLHVINKISSLVHF